MNQNFLVSKTKLTRIYICLLILVSFTIPLPVVLNNIAVGLLVLFWLITGELSGKLNLIIRNKFFWLFTSFYLVQLIGILYSADVSDALTKLEKKAGLLLFPFLLFSMPVPKLKDIFWIILAFSLSSFALVGFAVFQIFIKNGTLLNVPHLTETIDDIIHLHHAYSGLYLVFSICGLVYFLNHFWLQLKPLLRILLLILILSLYSLLIILGARMALFLSFLILGIQMLIFTIQSRSWRAFTLIATTTIIAVAGILSLPATRKKLHELLYFQGVYHPFTPRMIQWQCSIEIVDKNNAWLQGVGTGDVKPLLQACYQQKKFWGELYHYNSHNEYLEEMMRHGLIGLALLVLALLYPLIIAIRHRHYLYQYFLILFMLSCLSESILNRQKGVVFYAFFNALLYAPVMSGKKGLLFLNEEYSEVPSKA